MTTETVIAVRYPDCDMMHTAHHSVFAVWYEAARMDFFEKMGFSFKDMSSRGINPPLVDLHIKYRAPVHYPGEVTIKTRISFHAPKKLELSYELYYEGSLASEATSFHIWTGPDMKSIDLAAALPEVYAKIEAADPQTKDRDG